MRDPDSSLEEEYPAFRYRVLAEDSFERPIFFLQLMTSCSSGQKAVEMGEVVLVPTRPGPKTNGPAHV
jgi:hypothetical protein